MCGIAVCIRKTTCQNQELSPESPIWNRWICNNAARGPDSQGQKDLLLTTKSVSVSLSFIASTLHLRGSQVVPQPHSSEESIFCWNGEVFEGLQIPDSANDGKILFEALNSLENPDDITSYMRTIEGPYAFVFYHRRTGRLIFARDPLGRRSLLIHPPTLGEPYILISSVSAGNAGYAMEEVDPIYINSFDVHLLPDVVEGKINVNDVLVHHERTSTSAPPQFGMLARVNRLVLEDLSLPNPNGPIPSSLASVVDRFIEVLDDSVRIQIQNIPPPTVSGTARIAVLYSGGIDSTIIAFLTHSHIPLHEPIDLLNIAFENPRKRLNHQPNGIRQKGKKTNQTIPAPIQNDIYNVPDRLSGLEELEELRHLCPNRLWNFVEVNIDYAESSQTKAVVTDIMFPSQTVMDLSLALALYFAARGTGQVKDDRTSAAKAYTTPAKVLLSGLGADELLGGYGRHRSVFESNGWQGLIDELQLELDRLPSRNLGRDDRMISSHGRETRHPFLSLTVVAYLAALPAYLKVDPRLPIGSGDKMLLRLLAHKVGLECASKRKKRAMQFGSHSARMEVGMGGKDGEKLII